MYLLVMGLFKKKSGHFEAQKNSRTKAVHYRCYSSGDDQESDGECAEEMEACVDNDGNHFRDIIFHK